MATDGAAGATVIDTTCAAFGLSESLLPPHPTADERTNVSATSARAIVPIPAVSFIDWILCGVRDGVRGGGRGVWAGGTCTQRATPSKVPLLADVREITSPRDLGIATALSQPRAKCVDP